MLYQSYFETKFYSLQISMIIILFQAKSLLPKNSANKEYFKRETIISFGKI
jgi:hypothetical protein